MDMRTWLRQATDEERHALAQKVGSSVGYFYLIAGNHRRPGPRLCRALVEAEPKLTLWSLRPDVWEEPADPATGALTGRRHDDPSPEE
jgi:hypothetical protein